MRDWTKVGVRRSYDADGDAPFMVFELQPGVAKFYRVRVSR